jgi:acylglycerol lipase
MRAPGPVDGFFHLPGGLLLPYRQWAPPEPPRGVILALHGFNDSRDAWEYPAPALAARGYLVVGPDLPGFGAAPGRGRWPGTARLVETAAALSAALAACHPGLPLYLLGESMGGAIGLVLGARPDRPPLAGYVLAAPAVWGRAEMTVIERLALWTAVRLAPSARLSGRAAHIRASDNDAALWRLSLDPLTLTRTRVDALAGLVELMDEALAAAPRFAGPALVLYGGEDALIPKRAMRAAWRGLLAPPPRPIRLAYYPAGYHLLLRDHARNVVLADIAAWLADPAAPLPSGAEAAARAFLAGSKSV